MPVIARDELRHPLLALHGVAKRHGAHTVLDGISLDIAEGEFFCLLGPSGCGKSTLLRVIAGLDDLEAGRILLDGTDLASLPPHRRPVNLMFQSYALFPHLTVAENIGFGLRAEGLPAGERASRVHEMLSLLGLLECATRRPAQISGGQRQRVALARALVKRPRLLLLDEPLAALDRQLRESTQQELRRLREALGLTILMVTHDQEEAMTVADRVAVMRNGLLLQVATPREIYAAPASRAVATFIGRSNLIEVELETSTDRHHHLRTPNGTRVRHIGAPGNAPGRHRVLMLRPEWMRLSQSPGEHENQLLCTVNARAFLGDRWRLEVCTSKGQQLEVNMPGGDPAAELLVPGQQGWITWPAEAGCLLAP